MRSGKDTLGRYLCGRYGYTRYAFGDELKRYYHEIFGDPLGNTSDKPRQGYQWFGQAMREHEPGVWIRKMFERIDAEHPERIVVTDCRQVNEYRRLLQERFAIIRVECDEDIRIERMQQAGDSFTVENLQHETEVVLDAYPAHFVITNNGTVDEMIAQFELVRVEFTRL